MVLGNAGKFYGFLFITDVFKGVVLAKAMRLVGLAWRLEAEGNG